MINFYSDKRKILFYTFAYIIIIYSFIYEGPINTTELIILIPLSLFIIYYLLLSLLNRNSKLRIDDYGIELTNFIGTKKLIPWSDIKSAHIIEEPNYEDSGDDITITLKLNNPQLNNNIFIQILSKILNKPFFINEIKLTNALFSKKNLYKIYDNCILSLNSF